MVIAHYESCGRCHSHPCACNPPRHVDWFQRVDRLDAIARAFYRSQLAARLWELRREGACIRIRRMHCRIVGRTVEVCDDWWVTIGLPNGHAATVTRAEKVDAIANCLTAVMG